MYAIFLPTNIAPTVQQALMRHHIQRFKNVRLQATFYAFINKKGSFTGALKTGHSFEKSSSSRGKTAVTMPELPRSIKTIFNRTHLLSSSQAHFIESSKKAHVVCKIIQ